METAWWWNPDDPRDALTLADLDDDRGAYAEAPLYDDLDLATLDPAMTGRDDDDRGDEPELNSLTAVLTAYHRTSAALDRLNEILDQATAEFALALDDFVDRGYQADPVAKPLLDRLRGQVELLQETLELTADDLELSPELAGCTHS